MIKVCFGDVVSAVGKPVIDVLKEHYQDRLKDTRAASEAELQFRSITNDIIEHLQPTLDQAQERGVDVEPVVEQLGRAWDRAKARDMYRSPEHAEIVAAVRHDLDPAKLTAAINNAYRPPGDTLEPKQLARYERVLAESARYLVDVADTLNQEEFGKVVDTESLRRLSNLSADVRRVLAAVQRIERAVISSPHGIEERRTGRQVHIRIQVPPPGQTAESVAQAERFEAD